MAEVVWTEPALADLDAIADYIALEDAAAARCLVAAVFDHVAHLADHPRMGLHPPELEGSRYRQLIEPPVRIIYRVDGQRVLVLHVIRAERSLLRAARRWGLEKRPEKGTE